MSGPLQRGNDDRLLAALGRLGEQELSGRRDSAIRAQLETAWVSRARGVRPPFTLRRLAPVLAALVLLLGGGSAALGASADSPLWDARVALESAGASLRSSAADRAAYLLDLVQSRTEEAARQEAAGNPGAAAKARAAASAAVLQLRGSIPEIATELATPTPTPSPAVAPAVRPTDQPIATPTATPTSVPTPLRATAPSTVTTPFPAATPAATVHPATPSPTTAPTASPKQAVTITGTVHDSAGRPVTDACVTTSPTIPTSATSCIVKTTNGSYAFTATITVGQTITLYAYWTNTSAETFAGSATATATAPTTLMPSITLTLRR